MPSQALRFFIAAALAVFPAGGTTAQGWPSRPVTYIVPFSAGSGPDVLARNISNELTAKFNQPLIVENRPGANGNIGAAVVSKAAPDGYTFLSVTPGIAVQNIRLQIYALRFRSGLRSSRPHGQSADAGHGQS